jgi:hypothetical protein
LPPYYCTYRCIILQSDIKVFTILFCFFVFFCLIVWQSEEIFEEREEGRRSGERGHTGPSKGEPWVPSGSTGLRNRADSPVTIAKANGPLPRGIVRFISRTVRINDNLGLCRVLLYANELLSFLCLHCCENLTPVGWHFEF